MLFHVFSHPQIATVLKTLHKLHLRPFETTIQELKVRRHTQIYQVRLTISRCSPFSRTSGSRVFAYHLICISGCYLHPQSLYTRPSLHNARHRLNYPKYNRQNQYKDSNPERLSLSPVPSIMPPLPDCRWLGPVVRFFEIQEAFSPVLEFFEFERGSLEVAD